MNRLPLFPLPVVLLPGRRLPLHIFEERYRRMVARAVETRSPFGMVYHDPDVHGPFLMEEGRVGTEARIEAFQSLPDGRSLILVRGGARFRIQEGVQSEDLYYEAVVDAFPDEPPASAAVLSEKRHRSLALFLAALDALGGEDAPAPEVDPSAETSFALAASLEIDPSWLQALLELPTEAARLERLDVIFRAASLGEGNPPGGTTV